MKTLQKFVHLCNTKLKNVVVVDSSTEITIPLDKRQNAIILVRGDDRENIGKNRLEVRVRCWLSGIPAPIRVLVYVDGEDSPVSEDVLKSSNSRRHVAVFRNLPQGKPLQARFSL